MPSNVKKTSQTPETFAIEVEKLSKAFPGILANDQVSLQVRQGEIHALLGENGAGKSTLMSLIFGLYAPDSGKIRVMGRPCQIKGPTDAGRHKIGMVHQHFRLVETFSVTDNIMLGVEKQQWGILQRKQVAKEIRQLCRRYGLGLEPDKLINQLTIGQQQKVEILKMLYRENSILIFDEPTAVLMPQEIRELMSILEGLKAEGKTIILITHKLKEIRQVADRCTIMRRGRVIDTVEMAHSDNEQLTQMMIGHSINLDFSKLRLNRPSPPDGQTPLFSCEKLRVRSDSGAQAVKDVRFDLHRGQILGLAGVDGNGQMELVQALAGLRPLDAGRITFNGKDISNCNVRERIDMGMGYIPADRGHYGLILEENIGINMALKDFLREPYTKGIWLQSAAFRGRAEQLIAAYDIRCPQGAETQVRKMSGGNQQKVILAREISRRPSVILIEQPTRGLDVGAVSDIYRQILEIRRESAILLVSFELDEIISLADRIAVISDGRITGSMPAEEVDELQIGRLMAGEVLA
ncbi:ABC transporter ATP-binding protein [Candidatus Haliotispira prima]|uniref:ABC transporter ATP-binding protein n=1 Tax=Candidatus Haliotispira prima TaxID=3034016 RepID=A0ABY8MDM7_9SPIO|nr:ABC transporter ATP-binding protein [Candidatus Haliotispira prima]